MRFTIDIKPLSVNEAWQGRRKKSQKYHDFEREIEWLLPRNIKPLEGKIEIRYWWHMKNHKMADWDNPIKALQDVLKLYGIILDDRFIYKGTGEKVPSDRDYVEVEILPYEKAPS